MKPFDLHNTRSPGLTQQDGLLQVQDQSPSENSGPVNLNSLDKLLERDNQREKDGFPRKINVGRLIRPGKGGKDKIVIVPSTVEDKFIHDSRTDAPDESGGTGDADEGDIIGEQPVRAPEGSGAGPGEGEGAAHEMESNAYELGKILTEKFELPNLKDKGKKRSFTKYSYDMTDRNRGFGQVLDKKATLKRIVETNIHLGNIPDRNNVDASELLVSPGDRVYRILSRERDYESQAMIFFVRDYSGSMQGKPTTLVVSQHVLIYSWLLYQYSNQVDTRFILHDSDAKEVPDFHTYYNSRVAGGTQVASGYRLVNEIVEKENLAKDYNIYVFHGTDGDDWEGKSEESIGEIKKMLTYVSRMGITVAKRSSSSLTQVEKYMNDSGLLTKHPDLIRMDVINENADESRLIEGIKALIASNKKPAA
jgi:uncharacterized sporulation protein YeaH/YhbH (DUF444 family)